MTDINKSSPTWRSGSLRNGAAAIGSLLIPGLGQLAQKRFELGFVMFAFAFISWPIVLGWIFNIWACLNALRYNDGDKLGRKAAVGLACCLVMIVSIHVISQNPSILYTVAKLIARNVKPDPIILSWKPVSNILGDDEVEATVRNKGTGGEIHFRFTAGDKFEKSMQRISITMKLGLSSLAFKEHPQATVSFLQQRLANETLQLLS